MKTKSILNAGNLILGGAVIMLLFIFILIFSFVSQDLHVVTKDYYAEELKYNALKEEMKNAETLGNKINVSEVGAQIILALPLNISSSILKGTVIAYFPSSPSNDQLFEINKNNIGEYSIPVINPQHLSYVLKVRVTDTTKSYYKQFQL